MIQPPEPWDHPRLAEERHNLCREYQKEGNFAGCDTCPSRFVCWTSSKPDKNKPYRKYDIYKILGT